MKCKRVCGVKRERWKAQVRFQSSRNGLWMRRAGVCVSAVVSRLVFQGGSDEVFQVCPEEYCTTSLPPSFINNWLKHRTGMYFNHQFTQENNWSKNFILAKQAKDFWTAVWGLAPVLGKWHSVFPFGSYRSLSIWKANSTVTIQNNMVLRKCDSVMTVR